MGILTPIQILMLVIIGVGIFLIIAWRFLSRRRLLPCPSAFIWMLEHRLMENVAGSQALIQRAHIQPGMVVLDAGCGPGRVAIPIAQYVGPDGLVLAVDVQAEMLAKLAERLVDKDVRNLQVKRAALGSGELPLNTFDRALMVTVLGEIPDQESALEEIFKALKPGGILSITEVLPDPHYQSRRQVRKLAKRCGFKVDEAHKGWRSFTFNLLKSPS